MPETTREKKRQPTTRELLIEIRDLLRVLLEPNAHSCYHCGRMTMSSAAWCPTCLKQAEEERVRYPPRPTPRLPSPRRAVGRSAADA